MGSASHCKLWGVFVPACWSGAEVPGLAETLSGLTSLSPGVIGMSQVGTGSPWPMRPAACPALAGLSYGLSLQPWDHLGVPSVVLMDAAHYGGHLEGQDCPEPPKCSLPAPSRCCLRLPGGLQEHKGAGSPSAFPCL